MARRGQAVEKGKNRESRCSITLEERLEKIEAMLVVLVERQQVREWYTTHEFARTVGKAEFTIREWCRLGRIQAEKKVSGRGAYSAWAISRSECERYQRKGLRPRKSGEIGPGASNGDAQTQ